MPLDRPRREAAMVDEWARDDDYEYGYDYLYEEEKPADAAEDADGPDDAC